MVSIDDEDRGGAWPAGAALLLGVLRWDAPAYDAVSLARVDVVEWEAARHLAMRQGVGPLWYQRLQRHGLLAVVPVAVREALLAEYRLNALRNARIERELAGLVRLAAGHGIDVLALKGAALAAGVYAPGAGRWMLDLDVLVRVEQWVEFTALLEEQGYRIQGLTLAETGFALRDGHHAPAYWRSGGVCAVEVHWTVVDGEARGGLPMVEAWQRAVPLVLGDGTRLWQLAGEDALLYVAAHATYQHGLRVGLRALADVAQLVAVCALDWDVVCERARCHGWRRGLYVVLWWARDGLGAAVPEWVLGALTVGEEEAQLVRGRRLAWDQVWLGDVRGSGEEDLTRGAPLRLSRMGGVWDGLRRLWWGIFLPRAVLMEMYGARVPGWAWWWAVVLRVCDLMRHYWGSRRRLWVRRSWLQVWLAGG